MIKLSDILDTDTIKLEIKADRKKEVIRELLEVLFEYEKIPLVKNLFDDLIAREKITSTGIGREVAIPHKLIQGIDKTFMVFGRKESGINYGSIDGKPVKLFFLIIGPEGHHTSHLRILSKLSRLLHDDAFRDKLLNAETPGEIIEAVKEQESE